MEQIYHQTAQKIGKSSLNHGAEISSRRIKERKLPLSYIMKKLWKGDHKPKSVYFILSDRYKCGLSCLRRNFINKPKQVAGHTSQGFIPCQP